MSNIPNISIEELRAELAAGTITEFWNVLTDRYFSGELIPGSRRVPLDQVGRHVSREHTPNDAVIVVYCASVDCPQSGAAAEKLVTMGFTNVREFHGGLREWRENGLPLDRLHGNAAA